MKSSTTLSVEVETGGFWYELRMSSAVERVHSVLCVLCSFKTFPWKQLLKVKWPDRDVSVPVLRYEARRKRINALCPCGQGFFAKLSCWHAHQAYYLVRWNLFPRAFQNLVRPVSLKRKLAVPLSPVTVDYQHYCSRKYESQQIWSAPFLWVYTTGLPALADEKITVTTIIENITVVHLAPTIIVDVIDETTTALVVVCQPDTFFLSLLPYKSFFI